jgi:hypothetical protein
MKAKRGFEHDRTGFLLCTAELDWSDEECVFTGWPNLALTYGPRIRQQLRNKELTVSGSHWPIFLYQNERFNQDDPWQGLFRSKILVSVSTPLHTQVLS